MASKKDKAGLIHNLFLKLNGQTRQEWEKTNQKGHDFYLDNQLTKKEENALSEAGMPTFTINRIIPIVEMLNFYATANDPKWQAIGAEGSDADIAAVHNDIADYIWYISNGKQIMHQVINDACTKSTGYFQIYVDPNSDQGMGDVKLRNLEPFDVYIDPQSRDLLFRDAAFMMVHKVIPRAQLSNVFPQYKNKVKKANSQYPSHFSLTEKADGNDFQYKDINENFTILGEDDLLIDYYELYEKESLPFMNVFYRIEPSEQDIARIESTISQQMEGVRDEMQVQLLEQKKILNEQLEAGEIIQERFDIEIKKMAIQAEESFNQQKQQRLQQAMEEVSQIEQTVMSEKEFNILMKGKLKENLVDAVKFYDTKIKLSLCVGDELISESYLPGKEYPIVPIHYNWTGTPYAMSAVSPLIGKQTEMNKAHQLMVHNASLGSSLRWKYVDGSIDVDYWEQFASAPGALLPVNNGYEPPKEVLPAQLSAAFANIVAEGRGDLEYLAGIYSSMQGDVSKQPDTYKGLLANDEYGTRRVKAWVEGAVKSGLKQVGLLVKDYAQDTYTAEKVFRIVQPNNIQEQKEVAINVPIYNDYGDVIGKFNDYASANLDIRVTAGNSLPINRWAYLGELKELMQLGIVDDLAVLAETDVKNKEGIAERKSMYAQLQGQLSELEEKTKDQAGTIETLERQLVQAGIKDKVRQVEHDMRKKFVDTAARLKGDAAVEKANQDKIGHKMKTDSDAYKKDLIRDREIKKLQTPPKPE
jgi:hypothetical protein